MSITEMTILGFFLIFAGTTLGSALVYFTKNKISPKLNTVLLGFAGGVMIAASVWSLIIPSLNQSEAQGTWGSWFFVPTVVAFIIGGLFLVLLDKVVPHMHASGEEEGPKSTSTHKSTKLFLAVTLHNIPEGLAVGFAFGAAAGNKVATVAALGLAIGMAFQNFPEGAAVTLPLKQASGSKNKAFLLGAASGAVEPIFAVIGYFLSTVLLSLQPWFLAFAAGAMIFVVAEDLIPDAKLDEHSHLGTWGLMIGFAVMMILDVVLG